MRIYFDTEFIEDGKTIDLVSIGAVREDGVSFYAISSEFDATKANPWVIENVIEKLESGASRSSRKDIASMLRTFVGPSPEFWAYFSDYDWVVLCQLYGRMLDLPEGWPMYCRDLKQELDRRKLFRKCDGGHNALADAKWVRDTHAELLASDQKARELGFSPE